MQFDIEHVPAGIGNRVLSEIEKAIRGIGYGFEIVVVESSTLRVAQ